MNLVGPVLPSEGDGTVNGHGWFRVPMQEAAGGRSTWLLAETAVL